jgi:hypothetical protein
MSHQPSWSIEYDIREDAEDMFVPAQLLPHAQPGDPVELRSAQSAVTRQGRVAGRFDDEARGQFVTVRFDQRPSTMRRAVSMAVADTARRHD